MKKLLVLGLSSVFLVGCAAPDTSLSDSCDEALVAADKLSVAAKSALSARDEFIAALRSQDTKRIATAQSRLASDEAVVVARSEEYTALRDQCRDTDGFTN